MLIYDRNRKMSNFERNKHVVFNHYVTDNPCGIGSRLLSVLYQIDSVSIYIIGIIDFWLWVLGAQGNVGIEKRKLFTLISEKQVLKDVFQVSSFLCNSAPSKLH